MNVPGTGSTRTRKRRLTRERHKLRIMNEINDKNNDERVNMLEVEGWKREKGIDENKIFHSGPAIIEGSLHATDKMCLYGCFFITGKIECEGNFTLCGSVECWYVNGNSFVLFYCGCFVVSRTGVYVHKMEC
jgi:hypothetical protein